jgi:hypothetical protein
MHHAKEASNKKVLEFRMPHDHIGSQLVNWIGITVWSSNELMPALERLRLSYELLRTGKHVRNYKEVLWQVEEVLWQVEGVLWQVQDLLWRLHGALTDAQRSQKVLAPDPFHGRRQHHHPAVRSIPQVVVMVPQDLR